MFKKKLSLLRIFAWLRRIGYEIAPLQRRWASALFSQVFSRTHQDRATFRSIETLRSESVDRWTTLPTSGVRLTIVVVTYHQPLQLDCLLASLMCQTLQNFEVLVFHDGADEDTRAVVERFSKRSERYRYIESEVRYNDYGHTLRAMGIELAGGEYILITNGDNYYTPRFTEFLFDAIDSHNLDMVVWDIIHSYESPGWIRLRCYNPFRVYPVRGMVDMSSVVVRSELAKTVGFPDRTHSGDATYMEAIFAIPNKQISVGKIEKTLNVHN